MSRLIIDVSGEQHQKIKVLAALQGKSIKNYVLDKIFPVDEKEEQAWEELTEFLSDRISEAEDNSPSKKSFSELTKEIIQRRKMH